MASGFSAPPLSTSDIFDYYTCVANGQDLAEHSDRISVNNLVRTFSFKIYSINQH